MSNYNSGNMSDGGGPMDGRVRGARRQKVFGYLKAANELRQNYQAQFQQRDNDEDEQGIPGAFPDVEIVRSGHEEMVLFPSYARKHVKKHPANLQGHRDMPGAHEDLEHSEPGDQDYWRREWEKYEDDNAVVDVDVRGWIYSPHKPPMNRKNRLLVAVARRLSGIPAPNTPLDGGTPSELHSHSHSLQEHMSRRNASVEDEAAAREALNIVQRGEAEAKTAWRGGYSADPSKGYDSDTPPGSKTISPSHSADKLTGPGRPRHSLTDSEMASDDEGLGVKSLEKRASWNQPAQMSPEELKTANAHLMARLRPFMTVPLANTSITIFFFNDSKSQSRSIYTNEAGHFSIRASLDFVPDAIRVLASESLSATEKVIVTEDKGVSLVSDIDDTIKHSAISSGAREIFKNTFIRELGDLIIPGVKEWYNKMAEMGVKLHYVSNSPWQLYPLIRSYFGLAGLPAGSFHLKHYSGMLQGIFEPAAERKRGSLEKIMYDFPGRKFILVGDSGEADLEVYSEIVAENPGRILAVFIRDVTTPVKKKFFDQAVPNSAPDSRVAPRNGTPTPVRKADRDSQEHPPPLPTRQNTQPQHRDVPDLIDFDDDVEPEKKKDERPYSSDLALLDSKDSGPHKMPPTRPSKPSSLRSTSVSSSKPTNHDRIEKLTPASAGPYAPQGPSPGASPSSTVMDLPSTAAHSQPHPQTPLPPLHLERSATSRPPPPPQSRPHRTRLPHRLTSHKYEHAPPPPTAPTPDFYAPDYHQNETQSDTEGDGYAAAARRQITSAYNALPSIRSTSPSGANDPNAPPRPPPRRGLTSYPVAAARYVAGAATGASNTAMSTDVENMSPYNKKEEIWRRRWARAEELMRAHGVVLRSWRVGTDVIEEAVQVVQRGMNELERESGRRGGFTLMGGDVGRDEKARGKSA